jgi:hypothetical protein
MLLKKACRSARTDFFSVSNTANTMYWAAKFLGTVFFTTATVENSRTALHCQFPLRSFTLVLGKKASQGSDTPHHVLLLFRTVAFFG